MNIYVGNLSWQMTDEDLRTLFEQYGSVTSAKIVKDKVSGRSKGFGFVEMTEDTEAQNALSSLYDSEVLGRKIIVNEAQPKPQGGGAGGAGGFKKRSFGGGGNSGGSGGGYKKGGFNRGGTGGGYNKDY
jgi:RNA recognition motif-containing protein